MHVCVYDFVKHEYLYLLLSTHISFFGNQKTKTSPEEWCQQSSIPMSFITMLIFHKDKPYQSYNVKFSGGAELEIYVISYVTCIFTTRLLPPEGNRRHTIHHFSKNIFPSLFTRFFLCPCSTHLSLYHSILFFLQVYLNSILILLPKRNTVIMVNKMFQFYCSRVVSRWDWKCQVITISWLGILGILSKYYPLDIFKNINLHFSGTRSSKIYKLKFQKNENSVEKILN